MSDSSDTFKRLADDAPQRHDLFIGLVAPLGSSRDKFVEALTTKLEPYGYPTHRIRLADLLGTFPQLSGLPTRDHPEYYEARMNAGDRLRKEAGDWSGLAAVAVSRCASLRAEWRKAAQAKKHNDLPAPPRAYIFDSLKHPREAQLLRAVYGTAFWQLAIVEDVDDRLRNLAEELAAQHGTFDQTPDARAFALVSRDEADPNADNGQHVRDVFATSDFFLPVQRGVRWDGHLDRFLEGIFGAPFISPSLDEEAMRHASAASLRSAAIGRQVGAAIVPRTGAPLVVGANEVPKPGGGQFREGDQPDHRDFQNGFDPNPTYTERVILELLEAMANAKMFSAQLNDGGGRAVLQAVTEKDEEGKSILSGTRAKSLIEFTRCLHAEQAAIVDAARTGVAIGGARLYTTTFPCHECTKFIIGAGITRLTYIEPYPKSLASDLYRDLIDTVSPLDTDDDDRDRVPFMSFLGFAPTRFDDVFTAPERKSGSSLSTHDPATAAPVGKGWSEAGTRTREDEVVVAVGLLRESEWKAVSKPTAADGPAKPDTDAASAASGGL